LEDDKKYRRSILARRIEPIDRFIDLRIDPARAEVKVGNRLGIDLAKLASPHARIAVKFPTPVWWVVFGTPQPEIKIDSICARIAKILLTPEGSRCHNHFLVGKIPAENQIRFDTCPIPRFAFKVVPGFHTTCADTTQHGKDSDNLSSVYKPQIAAPGRWVLSRYAGSERCLFGSHSAFSSRKEETPDIMPGNPSSLL
jgi:hypothetical protein